MDSEQFLLVMLTNDVVHWQPYACENNRINSFRVVKEEASGCQSSRWVVFPGINKHWTRWGQPDQFMVWWLIHQFKLIWPVIVNWSGVRRHKRLCWSVSPTTPLPETYCQVKSISWIFVLRNIIWGSLDKLLIWRINVSVQLPQLKKSGAKISNWEVIYSIRF